jgi:DNA-binding response OmpR family regulator
MRAGRSARAPNVPEMPPVEEPPLVGQDESRPRIALLDDGGIRVADDIRPLTPTEYRILSLLWRHRSRLVPAEKIIEHLYGHDPNGGPLYARTLITVYMSKLRKKLAGTRFQIRNQWMSGYRLVEMPA